jgi:hypothetical protein
MVSWSIRCECQASKHSLVRNCLECGRVICAQEGPGPCLFCIENVSLSIWKLKFSIFLDILLFEDASQWKGSFTNQAPSAAYKTVW